jgi:hypothetical protein
MNRLPAVEAGEGLASRCAPLVNMHAAAEPSPDLDTARLDLSSPWEGEGRKAPYLSVVVAARHDDHGGNPLARLQLFLDTFRGQCDRLGLDAEVVLVEWNPPADRPQLGDTLRIGPAARCPLRIVEVPAAVHARLPFALQLPLFQMIAKNVGIRRSRGAFVLATNIDILFSDALVRRLARRDLRANRMYRVDRYDIPADVPTDRPLDFAQRHVIRINAREGTHDLRTGQVHRIYRPITWRERLMALRLWPITSHARLHTNACGDFTLMHRRQWERVRGYPELAMYSMHLDSVLCHAAHHAGARECVLAEPCRIYHIEHAPGSGFTPEHKSQLDARLRDVGVPQLSHDQFAAWARAMRRDHAPIVVNGRGWGMADLTLPEWTFDADAARALAA